MALPMEFAPVIAGISRRYRQPRSLPGLGAAALLLLSAGCTLQANPDAYEARLAQHLSETGAVMYGAYWCPHCATQKEMFGLAAEALPYVECDPEGQNAQPELCQAKNITGYPTWEIDGQLHPGVQPLAALAELSDFPAEDP